MSGCVREETPARNVCVAVWHTAKLSGENETHSVSHVLPPCESAASGSQTSFMQVLSPPVGCLARAFLHVVISYGQKVGTMPWKAVSHYTLV